MKMFMKMLSITALLVTVVACVTTTPIALPEKYNLDNDLKVVEQMSVVSVSNWNQMDNQSVMFTANGGKFYLLVLDRQLEAMDTKIGFLADSSSVIAGFAKIYVGSSSAKRFYTIEKIFELKGKDQVKEIKEQLSKN